MPSDSHIGPDDPVLARMMKQRIMQLGLRHCRTLNARIVYPLQRNGLLRDVRRIDAGKDVESALANESYMGGVSTSWGPLVAVKDESGAVGVVVTPDLVIDSDIRVRRAALRHIERGGAAITPRTQDVINQERGPFQSTTEWLPSAVRIFDALSDDFLVTLAGARQCFEQHIALGLDGYVEGILQPTIRMIGGIRPPIWNPSVQIGEIEENARACVEHAATLADAIEEFFLRYGYLPLVPSLSVPRVVELWLASHPDTDNTWNAVKEWGAKGPDPLRRFFAATVFLAKPELIPDGEHATVWSDVAAFLDKDGDSCNDCQDSRWGLRRELARHYCQYLECLWPCQDGEPVAIAAWWMAHQVVAAMPSDGATDHLRQSLQQFADVSHDAHRLAHPITKGSALRYGTLFLSSVWSSGLLRQSAKKIEELHPEAIVASAKDIITQHFMEELVTGYPPVACGQEDVYSFADGILSSPAKWIAATGSAEDIERFKGLTALRIHEMNGQELLDTTDTLIQFNPPGQYLVMRLINMAAYMDQISADVLWQKLENAQWRRMALEECSIESTAMACDMMIEVMNRCPTERSSYLPHFLATACQNSRDDKARNEHLLAFTIAASVSTGCVSAIERLVRGLAGRKTTRELLRQWRERLRSLSTACPPATAARIRPVLVALSGIG